MTIRFNFISGLPRSGSTLLSALLRQNPRFYAAMTSPMASLCTPLQEKMSGGEFSTFFDDDDRATMLRALFAAYYERKLGVNEGAVAFDTNRTWTARAALLGRLFPETRIICCVRDIGWIIDSVERMLAKNPVRLSKIFNFQLGSSVYGRVETLMNSESGLIGLPWSSMREAWFGENAKRLIVVPYENLTKNPQRTLNRLYEELGEPAFQHDFNNVEYEEKEYDDNLGMPGMHTVRREVRYEERQPIIPPDIFAKFATTRFWEKTELNVHRVKII
jgi:sulfotransferase